MKKVLVLLSTYNGEKYLEQLLSSLFNQKDVDLNVLVRDDGSKDQTLSILEKYACSKKLKYYYGDNLGYAKSFWHLLQNASDDYDYYAFCDQDDFWLDDKLISAINMMEKEENLPLLYTSNVIACDSKLNVLNKKVFNDGVLTFYQSLLKSILPGCTFVLNNKARKQVIKYNGYMESHDWAIYNIINAFGKVLYDQESHIKYRLHENNTLGVNNKFQYLKLKIKNLFGKKINSRSRFAKDFFNCYGEELNIEYAKATYNLGYYKRNKTRLLRDKHFSGFIFKIYVILGRI